MNKKQIPVIFSWSKRTTAQSGLYFLSDNSHTNVLIRFFLINNGTCTTTTTTTTRTLGVTCITRLLRARQLSHKAGPFFAYAASWVAAVYVYIRTCLSDTHTNTCLSYNAPMVGDSCIVAIPAQILAVGCCQARNLSQMWKCPFFGLFHEIANRERQRPLLHLRQLDNSVKRKYFCECDRMNVHEKKLTNVD